jgi:hypothetical protein
MRATLLLLALVCVGCQGRVLSHPVDGGTVDGDAGAAVTPSNERLQSDPGAVSCGAATCAIRSNPSPGMLSLCCLRVQDPAVAECVDSPGECESGSKFLCDESADCPAGQHCCFGGRTYGGSGCSPDACVPTSCTGFDCGIELCKRDGECASGRCYAYDCVNGRRIGSCNPLNADHLRALACRP